MKIDIKIISLLAVSVAFGVFVGWFAMRSEGVEASHGKAIDNVKVTKTHNGAKVKRITEISLERRGNGVNSVKIIESEATKPNLLGTNGEIEDEDLLTAQQKSIVKELQDALDNEDYKAVKRVLGKFTASVSSGGLGGNVPKVLRMKAIEALGWFSPNAVVDLTDFIFDPDDEVAEDAFSKFEMMLQDSELDDFTRAQVVKSMMSSLTDEDRVDSVLNSLMDMRNSVRADTIKTILANGTEVAKAKLMEQLEFLTDSDVTTVADVDKWLEDNPDDADDDEFYGGVK